MNAHDRLKEEALHRLSVSLAVPIEIIDTSRRKVHHRLPVRLRYRFFNALNKPRIKPLVPDEAYYWLLDRLTDNDGWRPLSYREKRGLWP